MLITNATNNNKYIRTYVLNEKPLCEVKTVDYFIYLFCF